MKTNIQATELIQQMKDAGINNKHKFTNDEYLEMLLRFQGEVTSAFNHITGSNTDRLNDLADELSHLAEDKGCSDNTWITRAIKSMNFVQRQLSIMMSGKNAEDAVARAVGYADRPEMVSVRNVYLTDGREQTELDNIILTSNGIIILEVKGTKGDVTINPNGSLSRGPCLHNTKHSIKERMITKNRLLKEALEAKGVDFPIHIDGYIVFSYPKSCDIRIFDEYRQQKWYRQGKIKYIISEYSSNVSYTEEQLATLSTALHDLTVIQKEFHQPVNFDEVRDDFAKAMEVLTQQNEPTTESYTGQRTVQQKKNISNYWWLRPAAAACMTIVGGAAFGIAAAMLLDKAYDKIA